MHWGSTEEVAFKLDLKRRVLPKREIKEGTVVREKAHQRPGGMARCVAGTLRAVVASGAGRCAQVALEGPVDHALEFGFVLSTNAESSVGSDVIRFLFWGVNWWNWVG